MENTIDLISVSSFDVYGNPEGYNKRTIFCDVHSASRSEFYQAAQAGIHPEWEVNVFFADYEGEPMARLDGVLYDVVRTFRRFVDYKTQLNESNSDVLVLTLERHVGVLPGLEGSS